MLFIGEGVEVSTDAFNILGNACGRTPTGSLEEHVLDEVGGPIFAGGFMTPTGVDPDAHRDAGQVGHGGRDDSEATREFGKSVHQLSGT